MTDTAHAPGRLMMHDMEFATIVTAKKPGQFIALAESKSFSDEINEANARRLVACWNACEDIPTEALEGGAVADLLEALDGLAGETHACLGLAESELREALGNTNFQILLNLTRISLAAKKELAFLESLLPKRATK